jgi:3-hydroxyacyl-CoA dehydrogenase/enoyl-CoA hydratase/3-hydroxybutyryl-CoA epimerase
MFDIQIDESGIAILEWNMVGAVNVLNQQSIQALTEVVEKVASDDAIRGAVLTSAKEGFSSGGDIGELFELETVEDVMSMGRAIHYVFRRLETCGKPIAVVMDGPTLGGGLELCLACHFRVVTARQSTVLSFPEVGIGLFPGAGGTQRFPRLVGLQESLLPLLQGKPLSPSEAQRIGLVSVVVADRSSAVRVAKDWILEIGNCIQPWDRKDFEVKGADLASVDTTFLFAGTAGMVRQQTGGNHPAPLAILNCLYEGLGMSIEQALDLELRYFAQVALSKQAKHMMRTLWFAMNRAKSGHARPSNVVKAEFKKIGVLGAGMMGEGIALVSAQSGLEVVLKDVDVQTAARGKEHVGQVLTAMVSKGKLTQEKADQTLGRIAIATSFKDFEGIGFVIEAVYEDAALKAMVTKEVEGTMSTQGIFASNTSTLPITQLAGNSDRPDHFIGLHFFSPVEKMQLVEIIMGRDTSDETLARSLDYVQKIKKVPIVVQDSRGFYTSRIFRTFVAEGMELLLEGAKPSIVEHAAKAAGMPVGPLAVADEVSLNLLYKIRKQYERDGIVEQGAMKEVVVKMVEVFGRTGRKGSGGFYEYPEGGKKHLWPDLATHFPHRLDQPSLEEVKVRLLHVQALESFRCLDEGVLQKAEDGDIGSVLGWGFPVYTGGALSYIDYVGISQFVRDCDEFALGGAARFEVPPSLRSWAKAGKSIHDWKKK